MSNIGPALMNTGQDSRLYHCYQNFQRAYELKHGKPFSEAETGGNSVFMRLTSKKLHQRSDYTTTKEKLTKKEPPLLRQETVRFKPTNEVPLIPLTELWQSYSERKTRPKDHPKKKDKKEAASDDDSLSDEDESDTNSQYESRFYRELYRHYQQDLAQRVRPEREIGIRMRAIKQQMIL